ncbi:DUF805 domain-containing protein [Lentilactobacillus hilgardii]|uniref:DUF805 domain-containing protein n=1 Tax=Lentilactobacillus hilgardii TaxID=1588 RepID=UPI0039EBE49E
MAQSTKLTHWFIYYWEFWSKAFIFNATATRSQYWIPWLINNVLFFGYGFITGQWQHFAKYGSVRLGLAPPNSLVHAVIILLVMTVLLIATIGQFTSRARRLHDLNLSNWLILLLIFPLAGNLVLFILNLMPSKTITLWGMNQSDY